MSFKIVKDDIVWNIGNKDDDYIHLSTSHAVHTADQNPQREIQFIGANLEFEMGETVEFSCVAAPFLFSNGIKWALETKKGKLVYQKDSKLCHDIPSSNINYHAN